MTLDIDRLIKALESWAKRDFDEYYLERSTGEVLSADMLAKEDLSKLKLVEEDNVRFILIKALEPQDLGELMESFLNTLEKSKVKECLEEALLNAEYTTFKNVVSEYPDIKEKWIVFHKSYMQDFAKFWLKKNGISISEK